MTYDQKLAKLRGHLEDIWENRLDERSAAGLATLLDDSPELQRVYVHALHMHASLISWSMDGRDEALLTQLNEAERQAADAARRPVARPAAAERSAFPSARTGVLWSTAAMLLLAVGLGLLWQAGPRPGEPIAAVQPPAPSKAPASPAGETTGSAAKVEYVAQITHLSGDVEWAEYSTATDFLLRLRRGERLGITNGVIEFRHDSGATMTLVGPAEYVATGSAEGRLVRGAIRGQAEGGNFRLLTPSADVLDLGTEFGVAVSGGGHTDVAVFDGEVRVSSLSPQPGHESVVHLEPGESVRVLSGGEITDGLADATRLYPKSLGSGRRFPDERATRLSVVDLLNANVDHSDGQPQLVATIDPLTGSDRPQPWLRESGPGDLPSNGLYHVTLWHPVVDGVFIPQRQGKGVQVSSGGDQVNLPQNAGVTWGPVWSRRKTHAAVDKFGELDFWGNYSFPVVQDRFDRCELGMVGMHANVGVCLDLNAVEEQFGVRPRVFRSVVANLDNSTEHNQAMGYNPAEPPRYSADLRVFVDGRLAASRLDFARDDGEIVVEAFLRADSRFLTIVSTDASAKSRHKAYDHVVLIDPTLQ